MHEIEGNVGTTCIKGVLFDKDGTLFDYHGTWGPILTEFASVC
jgi:phosphoglycolate phosphatase-like HAD superfamily hydrolase|tara:strand:- start:20423 stop:20551 length:129 start_codon:yes stop_codon:yes gene_type:complete